MAHIIVVGNEKGGAGKSTVSMHVATALARMGHRTGALDLDLRQRSVGRYIENRRAFCKREGLELPIPLYLDLPEVAPEALAPGENAFDHRLSKAVALLCDDNKGARQDTVATEKALWEKELDEWTHERDSFSLDMIEENSHETPFSGGE